jgi:RNA polymerase sigma factor (sigma-70 family)
MPPSIDSRRYKFLPNCVSPLIIGLQSGSKVASSAGPNRQGWGVTQVSDFQELLNDEIPRLMRYASALARDPEAAIDLVEDTVREALAQERTGARETELQAWLLTILHEQRDNPFRRDGFAGPSSARAAAADPSLSRFDHALAKLPEEQRAVILLIGLEGMSYDKTASILGISVGAMRSRLLRGRNSLRQSMARPRTAAPARPHRPEEPPPAQSKRGLTSSHNRRRALTTRSCGMRPPQLSSARMPSNPISSCSALSRVAT